MMPNINFYNEMEYDVIHIDNTKDYVIILFRGRFFLMTRRTASDPASVRRYLHEFLEPQII